MATAVSRARLVRIAPRKVRLVADLIRGKKVGEARDILTYTLKASAPIVRKVLESAVASVEDEASRTRTQVDTDEMRVSKILVNEGPTVRRYQPVSRGRAMRIRKRTSQIELVIQDD